MALPLIPLLGPLLIKGFAKLLPGRLVETWAPRLAKLVGLALVAGLLWLAFTSAIGAIRADARKELLIEQAAERAAAIDAQREREWQAEARRRAELTAGAATDATLQKEMTDATQDLPDTRPSARQRSRVCVELQQQDRAAGRPARSC